MPIIQATGPLVEENQNRDPTVQGVGSSNVNPAPVDPHSAERVEAAFQGIMSSLITFVNKSLPLNLTEDQLDGITTYFSIRHDKIISYTNVDDGPADVDFDDMVSDRPTLFTRVAITSKTKPMASMVPESSSIPPSATSATPPTTLPPTSILYANVPSMLKRLAREPPTSGSQPVKRIKVLTYTKKAPRVPLQDFVEEVPVVELDSCTTISDHRDERDLSTENPILPLDTNEQLVNATEKPPTINEELPRQREGKAVAIEVTVPPYDGKYLMPPYRLPNLEVTREAPRNTRRYVPLKDPFACSLFLFLYINEALNGAYVLAKRTDRLTHQTRNVEKKIEVLRKVIATKHKIFAGAKKDLLLEREEREKLSEAAEERDQKLKATLAELKRVKEESVVAERNWVVEKTNLQKRYRELEMSSARDLKRTTEVLQKEKETALASAVAKAKVARSEYAQKTVQAFLRINTYTRKVGRECAAYLTHLFSINKEEFLEWSQIYEAEQTSYPLWYEGLSLDPPAVGEDEGVVDSLGDANVELPSDD
ncbi:hypothetical protein LIER_30468 [Lithospermum erythrorhizon]|uniref:Uncharacterized protein n=1 Tax=Lithospermum erythrorhizon TaxID=34254 RepID=A0AAV3RMT1_LITER